MSLERTFREFCSRLYRLRDRLDELRLTVIEDRPVKDDGAVVDNIEYAIEDLHGWVNEALEAALSAVKSAAHPVNMASARHSLGVCQERFHRIEKVFTANLVSYDRMNDLTTFGRERRGEWPSWVTSVKQGIEHCQPPVEDAGQALAECWQEIAEQVGATMIAVSNTNVGVR